MTTFTTQSEWVDFTRNHSGGNNDQREIIKRKNYYYRRIINGFLRKQPTNYYYILHRSRFSDIRQELILSISNIPVNIAINLLLFGTNEWTDEQNTLIFVSIQKYIIKSKIYHDHMAYHTLVTYISPQN
jgi:hypothetical protein